MLYHWLVQASLLIVKIQTDLDDQVDPVVEKEITFTHPKRILWILVRIRIERKEEQRTFVSR